MKKTKPSFGQESGAALIVGLFFLLILTMMGVAALRTTTLEERMAGNSRDSNIAFQSAESALREAIANDLYAKTYDGTVTGYTEKISEFKDSKGNNVSEFEYWTSVHDWKSKSVAATKPSGVAETPAYVVEAIPANTGLWKAGEPVKRVYRITAASTGASTRAQAIVQGTIVQE